MKNNFPKINFICGQFDELGAQEFEFFNKFALDKCKCPTCGGDSLKIREGLSLALARGRGSGKFLTELCYIEGFCSIKCLENYKNAINVLNRKSNSKN